MCCFYWGYLALRKVSLIPSYFKTLLVMESAVCIYSVYNNWNCCRITKKSLLFKAKNVLYWNIHTNLWSLLFFYLAVLFLLYFFVCVIFLLLLRIEPGHKNGFEYIYTDMVRYSICNACVSTLLLKYTRWFHQLRSMFCGWLQTLYSLCNYCILSHLD